jgi:hypothetical protein
MNLVLQWTPDYPWKVKPRLSGKKKIKNAFRKFGVKECLKRKE